VKLQWCSVQKGSPHELMFKFADISLSLIVVY